MTKKATEWNEMDEELKGNHMHIQISYILEMLNIAFHVMIMCMCNWVRMAQFIVVALTVTKVVCRTSFSPAREIFEQNKKKSASLKHAYTVHTK